MPLTNCDLYRSGNNSSPRMDNVRDSDAVTFINPDDGGKVWVRARQKGISTFNQKDPEWRKPWKLTSGYNYSASLHVENDHGNHYAWQPSVDMPLTQFEQLLRTAGDSFNKDWN